MDSKLLFGLNCLDCKGFKQLLDTQSLVDCTLACEGGKISAHKLVLSACSSYLAKILLDHPVEHPIIILPELNIEDVRTLVHYMYTGELLKSTTINSISLLKTAAILSINSLNDLLLSSSSTSPNTLINSFNQFANATNNHNVNSSVLNPSALMQFQQQDRMSIMEQISPLLAAISQQTQQHQHNTSTSFGRQSMGGLSFNQNDDTGRNLSTSSHDSNSSTNSSNLSNLINSASVNQTMDCHSAAMAQLYNSLTGAANSVNVANLNSSSSSLTSPPPSVNGRTSINPTESFPYLSSMVTVPGSNASSNSSGGSQPTTAGTSSNEFQFKCPVCENHFQTICSFEYHMQRVHSVTSFGCEICNKPFASLRYVLTDHMRRCHGGWKGATTSSAGQSGGKNCDQDHSEHKQSC